MKEKNPTAVKLGHMAAGHPKHYSAAELYKRAKRMKEMNKARAKK